MLTSLNTIRLYGITIILLGAIIGLIQNLINSQNQTLPASFLLFFLTQFLLWCYVLPNLLRKESRVYTLKKNKELELIEKTRTFAKYKGLKETDLAEAIREVRQR